MTEKGCKLLLDSYVSHFGEVEGEDSRVEILVSRDAEYLFGILRENFDVGNHFVGHCRYEIFSEGGMIELGDVVGDDYVAVKIHAAVVLGEHLGYEEAIVGSFGIVVAHVESLTDTAQLVGDAVKVERYVFGLHIAEDLFVFIAQSVDKDVYFIIVFRGAVCDERIEGYAQKRDVIIVGCENIGISSLVFFLSFIIVDPFLNRVILSLIREVHKTQQCGCRCRRRAFCIL